MSSRSANSSAWVETKTIKVDVRVLLSTTNRDSTRSVEKGEIREDLYYRLNVFPILVPALRERREDIALLAQNFVQRFARKHGIAVTGFSEAAIEALNAHAWPGNVRELQNTIERSVILSENGACVEVEALGLSSIRGLRSSATLSEVRPSAAEPQGELALEPLAAGAAGRELDAAPEQSGSKLANGTGGEGAIKPLHEMEKRRDPACARAYGRKSHQSGGLAENQHSHPSQQTEAEHALDVAELPLRRVDE